MKEVVTTYVICSKKLIFHKKQILCVITYVIPYVISFLYLTVDTKFVQKTNFAVLRLKVIFSITFYVLTQIVFLG